MMGIWPSIMRSICKQLIEAGPPPCQETSIDRDDRMIAQEQGLCEPMPLKRLLQSHSIFPHMKWSVERNTPQSNIATRSFEVTHCFHPLYGKTLALVDIQQGWGGVNACRAAFVTLRYRQSRWGQAKP